MTPIESAAKELVPLTPDELRRENEILKRQKNLMYDATIVLRDALGQRDLAARREATRLVDAAVKLQDEMPRQHFAPATRSESFVVSGPDAAQISKLLNSAGVSATAPPSAPAPSRSIQRLSTPADQPLPTFEKPGVVPDACGEELERSRGKLLLAAELLSTLSIEGAHFLRRLSCYEKVQDTEKFYDAICKSESFTNELIAHARKLMEKTR